jgi:LytR cell envelope-related transcriptional attenuator
MTADASAAVRTASGASAASSAGASGQASSPVRARGTGGQPPASQQRTGATTYSRSRRSPARATVLIVGAVVIGVVAVVLVVSSLGGSGGKSAANTATSTTTAHAPAHHTHTSTHPSEVSTPTVNPAEAQVAVLNGTSTPNLAHRLSASLQQSGYSQATPLNGTPPGSHQTTVVEYSSGHRAEAAQVAQVLGVSQVQPIEAAVSPLVGSSTVVVIAGLDKAGEASSSGSGGEASSGGGGGAVP